MATKAEIRQRVGEDLSLVTMGQALQSQDQARIDATYDEVYERLKEENLATWASTAPVPDKIVPYYALMMEEKLARSYGTSDARYQRIIAGAGQDGDLALQKIARLVTPAHESVEENVGY